MSTRTILRHSLVALLIAAIFFRQLDGFPLSKHFRPSEYLFGWPYVFGIVSDRWIIEAFSLLYFIIDSMVMLLLICLAIKGVKHLFNHLPKLSLADLLSIPAGLSLYLTTLPRNSDLKQSQFDNLQEYLGVWKPLSEESVFVGAGHLLAMVFSTLFLFHLSSNESGGLNPRKRPKNC